MIMQYLKNPYIMAAVIGGGVFVGLTMFDMPMLDSIAAPMTVGLIAALSYLGYLYFKGRLDLPIIGRRKMAMPMYDTLPEPSVATMRAMSSSMSDLLSPDQF